MVRKSQSQSRLWAGRKSGQVSHDKRLESRLHRTATHSGHDPNRETQSSGRVELQAAERIAKAVAAWHKAPSSAAKAALCVRVGPPRHLEVDAQGGLIDVDKTQDEMEVDADADADEDADADADADGEVEFSDDYNNKDKSRNFWLSVNVSF